MNRISNIVTTGNVTTAHFETDDVSEVNLLRRAILSHIPTYAIQYVTFQVNTSARHSEVVAHRLGQLPIDQETLLRPENGPIKGRIDVQGPAVFTTEDIPDLPFKQVTPIMTLRDGQRILCDYIVEKGTGADHAKWKPVSTCSFNETKNGYIIKFKGVDMLSGEEILRLGMENLQTAADYPASNLFYRVLRPGNM